MRRECESCVKRKTKYCPTSMKCMATDDVPYYQNRFMLLYKNKKYKDNWNKLREIIRKKQDYYRHFKDNRYRKFLSELLDIMQEIEGSDSNE